MPRRTANDLGKERYAERTNGLAALGAARRWIDRRQSMTGIPDVCARAANGHAAAVPPTSPMNSRHCMPPPRIRMRQFNGPNASLGRCWARVEMKTLGVADFRNGSNSEVEERLPSSALPLPAQPVDATQALNLSAGVSNCKVSRGRSLS
jgi:hypothetical protein